MLQACEALTRSVGNPVNKICLHVNTRNDGAFAMYRKQGYQVLETDSIFKLITGGREHLMALQL
jgi:ribosomal protein S18 acetylase RimI-like enzyme